MKPERYVVQYQLPGYESAMRVPAGSSKRNHLAVVSNGSPQSAFSVAWLANWRGLEVERWASLSTVEDERSCGQSGWQNDQGGYGGGAGGGDGGGGSGDGGGGDGDIKQE